MLLLSFSYKFHLLTILYLQNLTTLFYLGTFCQTNVNYRFFKILTLLCVRSNKAGCGRGPPGFSLLATAILKVLTSYIPQCSRMNAQFILFTPVYPHYFN